MSFFIGIVHGIVGGLTHIAIVALHEPDVVAVGQLRFFTIDNLTELHIRIVKHGEYVVCGPVEFPHLSHYCFLISGQNMPFLSECIAYNEFINLQVFVIFYKIKQNIFIGGNQFR